jgi:hypothetical protein
MAVAWTKLSRQQPKKKPGQLMVFKKLFQYEKAPANRQQPTGNSQQSADRKKLNEAAESCTIDGESPVV